MAVTITELTDGEEARLNALVGYPYELDLYQTNDASGACTWTVSVGDLPTGLQLDQLNSGNDSIAKIHSGGLPLTVAEAETFTLQAHDGVDPADTYEITITVRSDVPPTSSSGRTKVPVIIQLGQSHNIGAGTFLTTPAHPDQRVIGEVYKDSPLNGPYKRVRVWTGRGGPKSQNDGTADLNVNNGLQYYDAGSNSARLTTAVASGPDTTLVPRMLKWVGDNLADTHSNELILLKIVSVASLILEGFTHYNPSSGGWHPDRGEAFLQVQEELLAIQDALGSEYILDIVGIFFLHGQAEYSNTTSGEYGKMLLYFWQRLEDDLDAWMSDADKVVFVNEQLDLSSVPVPLNELDTTISVTAPSTIADSGSGFTVAVGDRVKLSGCANTANNSVFTVASASASSITVSESTLITESAGDPEFHKVGKTLAAYPTALPVIEGQNWAARQDKRYGQVDMYGLIFGSDDVHYRQDSTFDLGERMADEFERVYARL